MKVKNTGDQPVVPIIPTHREGHGTIDKSFGKLDVTTWNGQVRNHFTQGDLAGNVD